MWHPTFSYLRTIDIEKDIQECSQAISACTNLHTCAGMLNEGKSSDGFHKNLLALRHACLTHNGPRYFWSLPERCKTYHMYRLRVKCKSGVRNRTLLFRSWGSSSPNVKCFLHKVQLHVSALDNGHLKVVHEILIKQLYKTYMGCLYGEVRGKVGTRSRICQKGWAVWVTWGVHAVT